VSQRRAIYEEIADYRRIRLSQFSSIEIANWLAIYLATGLCCLIALALSVTVALHDSVRERVWSEVRDMRSALLFVPKLWWRWQKLYLLSTPVTLGIVFYFAASLRWS
jgi:hypothetical protein